MLKLCEDLLARGEVVSACNLCKLVHTPLEENKEASRQVPARTPPALPGAREGLPWSRQCTSPGERPAQVC